MSAEGGELTFVRCPSCRSLVPAVSTRCRWCGNSLGGSASSEAPKEETPARRVRQKTRSIQAGEYVPQPTREKGSQEGEGFAPEEDYDLDDPLKGFIEEVEEEISDEEILSSLAEVEDERQRSSDREISNGISRPEVSRPEPSMSPEEEYESYEEELDLELEPYSETTSDAHLNSGMQLESSALEEITPVSGEIMVDEDVVDTISPDTFGETLKAEASVPPARPVEPPNIYRESPDLAGIRSQPQRYNSHRVVTTARAGEKGVGYERIDESSKRPPAPAESGNVSDRKLGEKMNNTQYEAAAGGKLFGWLVSYSDAEGKAFELREGRFFVSGSPLKGNDFVIKDPSVSTPHAMVNVTRTGGFAIQDLMSDRGIFIRKRGQDTYQREDGIAKCSSGDWIRVGDVEYVLTVVADIGK